MTQEPLGTRASRQAARRERLELTIAAVRSRLEIMQLLMNRVEFKSLLIPPLPDRHARDMIESFMRSANELQDAAGEFAVFCDCQFPQDDEPDTESTKNKE